MPEMTVMGKSVGKNYIRNMKFLFGTLGVIILVISFYLLSFQGANRIWSGTLASGVFLTIVSYWMAISPKIHKIENNNPKAKKFLKSYSKFVKVILVLIFGTGFFVGIVKGLDILKESPYFQIVVLGGTLILIILIQYYFWHIKKLDE
ncbi:MAG: hypothetical protein V3V78_04630 [Candidatus Woesearchaeota archaeon]